MKTKLLFFFLCVSITVNAQNTPTIYIDVIGQDIYYKTETDVYLASLKLTFTGEVYQTIVLDNITSWQNIYSDLQLNSGSSLWTVERNPSDKKSFLMYTNAQGVLASTEGEYVKFFTLTDENTLVSIDDAAVFKSTDAVMEASELLTPNVVVGNETLSLVDTSISELGIYPNPVSGNTLEIKGLKESCNVTIYDVTGKIVGRSFDVSSSNNTLSVGHLHKSVYLLNIENGLQSNVLSFLKN